MEKIDKGIVYSNDIKRILDGNNALDYSYKDLGLVVPNDNFINMLRDDFSKDTNRIFNGEVTIVSEEDMLNYMYESIKDVYGKVPIVSLDKIYLGMDENIRFLDCTRLDGSKNLVSRNNSNDFSSVDNNIRSISNTLDDNKRIVLADDVVFSGSVLKTIIEKFKSNGIDVIGVRSAIATTDSYNYFNFTLPLGLKCGCLLGSDVIDQICERDFYFGIAQSGISIKKDNTIYKAPYFRPFGDPVERSSIPKEYEEYFSKGCLIRSISLWDRIEKLSGKEVLIKDLPEVIYNTKEDDSVVKVLKRGVINYEKNTNRNNGISR